MAGKHKILIIEDDAAYRKLLTDIFSLEGFEVQEASDGVNGVYLAQVEGGFDAIITDLKMPNMDGLELLGELQKKPVAEKNGPIVVVTSVTQDYIKEEALRRGAKEVIAKDEATPNEIVGKITALIAENQES